jgi:signal transduction histidine kinase
MDSAIMELILQDRGIAYAITDRNLKVAEISDAPGAFCPNSPEACLGQSLLKLVPELLGNEAILADILAGKLPRFQLSWVNRETPAGQTIYLNMVALPYHDRRGQITGLIHLIDDVTEMGTMDQRLVQHRNELSLLRDQLARHNQELANANAELQHLADVKSAFVSIAAHELRSPQASITGFIEVLLDEDYGPLTQNQREYLEIVQHSAQRLLSITNNLLDVTRIEAERIELQLHPINLMALIEKMATEFRPVLKAKAQTLVLNTPADLPPALCDKTRALQIISNLVSNANKYTLEEGLLTISLALAETEGFLQISVADNGVGIPPEDQAKLFGRFFRARSAILTGASGTGLGLYITRCLVELHGGRIWFDSKLGQGSTFYVTFPIADSPAPAALSGDSSSTPRNSR